MCAYYWIWKVTYMCMPRSEHGYLCFRYTQKVTQIWV